MVYCNKCKKIFIHDNTPGTIEELKEMMRGDSSVGWYGMTLLEAHEELKEGMNDEEKLALEEATSYIQQEIDETAKAEANDYEEWRKANPEEAMKIDKEEAEELAKEKMDLEHRKSAKKVNAR